MGQDEVRRAQRRDPDESPLLELPLPVAARPIASAFLSEAPIPLGFVDKVRLTRHLRVQLSRILEFFVHGNHAVVRVRWAALGDEVVYIVRGEMEMERLVARGIRPGAIWLPRDIVVLLNRIRFRRNPGVAEGMVAAGRGGPGAVPDHPGPFSGILALCELVKDPLVKDLDAQTAQEILNAILAEDCGEAAHGESVESAPGANGRPLE